MLAPHLGFALVSATRLVRSVSPASSALRRFPRLRNPPSTTAHDGGKRMAPYAMSRCRRTAPASGRIGASDRERPQRAGSRARIGRRHRAAPETRGGGSCSSSRAPARKRTAEIAPSNIASYRPRSWRGSARKCDGQHEVRQAAGVVMNRKATQPRDRPARGESQCDRIE